jgi:ubiquinone/menaquinone biosynthesis C-methylase UbiE
MAKKTSAKKTAPKARRKPHATPDRIFQMTWAFAAPLSLHAAVENRVFDVLDRKPMTLEQLWAATGCSTRGIRALVEALAGFGVLKRKGKTYSLAPDISAFLVRGKPGFLGGVIRHIAGQLMDTWSALPQCVRTGQPARSVNRQDGGAEFFSQFVEDLFDLNYPGAAALAEHLASKIKKLRWTGPVRALDIAAGSGVWSIALAQRVPSAQITAVDWPAVTPVTQKVAQRHGVRDRLRTLDGDLLQVDVGNDYHVAFLGHILHSEGEARSKKLLKRIYDALAPGGIVAIAEFAVNEDRSGPPNSLVFALNMLVHTDEGDTYSFNQMTQWLRQVGFGAVSRLPIPGPSPILLGVKPTSSK